jgi:hypothetical protein
VKVGTVWALVFGNQLVGIAPSRKRALRIASIGNTFLDKLQLFGLVDTTAFAATFAAYLQAASDPAMGFVPVMRIT